MMDGGEEDWGAGTVYSCRTSIADGTRVDDAGSATASTMVDPSQSINARRPQSTLHVKPLSARGSFRSCATNLLRSSGFVRVCGPVAARSMAYGSGPYHESFKASNPFFG
jgi:hypothetical protein